MDSLVACLLEKDVRSTTTNLKEEEHDPNHKNPGTSVPIGRDGQYVVYA